MKELSLLIWRLRAIQAFAEDFERRCRRGEGVTLEPLSLSEGPQGWLSAAARRITEGLRFRFVARCDTHRGRGARPGG